MSRSSDLQKLAAWRERFQRFSSSGLGVARFCAREGVSVASFYHRRKRLGQRARRQRATARPGSFRPVAVVPAAPGVSIQLPCGTRIEVDADHLEAVRAVIAEVARAEGGHQAGVATC